MPLEPPTAGTPSALKCIRRLVQDHYREARKHKALDLFLEITSESFDAIADGSRALRLIGSLDQDQIRRAQKMFYDCPAERRTELADLALIRPALISVYSRLKPVGLRMENFLAFAFEDPFLPLSDSDALDAVGFLAEQCAQGAFREQALFLLEANVEPLREFKGDKTRCVAFLRSAPQAFLLLPQYIESLTAGDEGRANFLERVNAERLDIKTLKQVAERVMTASASEIDKLRTRDQVTKWLKKVPLPATIPNLSPNAPKRDWQDAFAQELEMKGINPSSFQIAVRVLYPHSQSVLRMTYRLHGEVFQDFCREIEQHHSNDAFLLLLSDKDLLPAYLDRLRNSSFSFNDVTTAIRGSTSSNLYAILHNFFLPDDTEQRIFFALGENTNIDPEAQQDLGCGRIVFAGGGFSTQTRQRFAESAGALRLAFFDPHLGDSLPQLSPNDIVVSITSRLGHSSYWRIKDQAARSGAKFFHFTPHGTQPVIGLIEKIAEASAAA